MIEVDPKETSRAYAFEMWLDAPMPMVTLFKIIDVTRIVRISRQKGLKFNMLLCWCIGRAASKIKEFYMLPIGRKMFRYDNLAIGTIVANHKGEVSSCDVPFHQDLQQFSNEYLKLTNQVAKNCINHDLPESMVIGTSAMVQYEIDGVVGKRSLQQSVSDMEQIQTAIIEVPTDCFLSVPSHTDGWRTSFTLY